MVDTPAGCCLFCGKDLSYRMRKDAKFCSPDHRIRYHKQLIKSQQNVANS